MLHSPSFFKVSKPSLAGISKVCTGESSAPDGLSPHSNYLISCCLHSAPQAHPSTVTGGKKAYRRGLSWHPSGPLSPGEALDAGHTDTRRHLRLSSLAASHPPRLVHTCAGCGHGGTRNSSTSRSVQTWSVSPAAMAGV